MRLFGDFFPARFVLSPQVQSRGRQFDFEKLVVRSAGLFSRGARVATRFLSLFHGVLPSTFLFMVEVGDPRLALFGLSFFFGVWCVGALGRCSSLSSGIIKRAAGNSAQHHKGIYFLLYARAQCPIIHQYVCT